jgi:hypothetical protein
MAVYKRLKLTISKSLHGVCHDAKSSRNNQFREEVHCYHSCLEVSSGYTISRKANLALKRAEEILLRDKLNGDLRGFSLFSEKRDLPFVRHRSLKEANKREFVRTIFYSYLFD